MHIFIMEADFLMSPSVVGVVIQLSQECGGRKHNGTLSCSNPESSLGGKGIFTSTTHGKTVALADRVLHHMDRNLPVYTTV